MSNVLCVTSPARGHLFPVVPVLTELQRRGHQVSVRTLAAHVADLQGLGLRALPLDPQVESIPLDDWRARTPAASQARAMRAFARRAPYEAADTARAIRDERPDLVLVDVMAFGAAAAAEASGVPWAVWLPYPAWLRRPGVPPYGPGLAPRTGPVGRLRDGLLTRALAAPGRHLVEAANAGRAAAGLPSLSQPDDVLLRPPLVLSMTAPELEHSGAWPDSFELVGPLSWEPPAPAPPWLDEDPRPVVLVSTSTEYQDDLALAHTAVEALAGRRDVRVVVTLPAAEQRWAGEVPPGVRVEQFVPHSHVLPRCSVVVCHGGAGVTYKALAAGVPVCVVPWGRDQLEVARRVELSGAGSRLPRRRLTPARLAQAVHAAESRSDAARDLARRLSAAGGAPLAVDALARLLAAPPARVDLPLRNELT